MSAHIVVVISGKPGAGKTTMGKTLSERLEATLLSKDLLKETLYEPMQLTSPERSLAASNAAMRLIYAIASTSWSPIVVESNWKGMDVPQLLALNRPIAQVTCTAPLNVLKERMTSRLRTGERHPVHRDAMDPEVVAEVLAVIEQDVPQALPLPGDVLEVDTSKSFDVDAIASWVNGHAS